MEIFTVRLAFRQLVFKTATNQLSPRLDKPTDGSVRSTCTDRHPPLNALGGSFTFYPTPKTSSIIHSALYNELTIKPVLHTIQQLHTSHEISVVHALYEVHVHPESQVVHVPHTFPATYTFPREFLGLQLKTCLPNAHTPTV